MCSEGRVDSHTPSHLGHESGTNPEEGVKVAKQRAAKDSMVQAAMMEGHE
jgi:hypothetical protein